MPIPPGALLGTYRILGPLGAGGMGEVYRARDTRLGRDVAVKVLPDAVASDPGRLARFQREARAVAALNHPNIVTIHSIEEEDGVPFLTLELVEGRTLAAVVAGGGLPIARVVDLAIPLADALAAAHAKGIVHRDLKPGNVMVTPEGRVKVLDFGLAKTLVAESGPGEETRSAAGAAPVSVEGRMLGTVPYMAPEQVRGEEVDERTDLFALGVVLYELSAGRRPFRGSTTADLASSILRDDPEPLAAARGGAPADLARVIARLLEKERARRFQTAAEVRRELESVRAALPHGATPHGAPAVLPPPMASVPPPGPLPGSAGGIPSIAVLPFVNRSRDEADEYFSEGLADELLNVLAKIPGLRVAARSSAFTFKDRRAAATEVGRALNVATVLEGAVRKTGSRVRISVQLVSAADGYHLWSEAYDRTLDDIFAVQDDIAQTVVNELRAMLLGEPPDSKGRLAVQAEVAAAARGRGASGEAHRLYLQGRYFVDRGTREETRRGIAHLQQALDLDPGHALAWAELARAWMNEANGGWTPHGEANERARKAAERALEMEPDLAEAHARLGGIRKNHDWDWRGAESSYRRALALAPGNSVVLDGAGVLAESLGRLDEAIALMERSVAQDPLSSASYSNLALVYQAAGRLDEAERTCRKAVELSPRRIGIHANLALILLDQGRAEEALREAGEEPMEVLRLWARALIHHAAGRREEADRALGELIGTHARDWAYQIAEVCAARGGIDAAFEWLERAYAERDGGLAYLKPDRLLRPLHADPRWADLMRRMGFEQ